MAQFATLAHTSRFHYDEANVRAFCTLAWTVWFLFALPAYAQNDFGSKFFEDLRKLFGELQRTDLDRALQRAKPIRCTDLVAARGEWKQVAFFNDDRTLGDWHHSTIDDVRRDLSTFVFSGVCRGQTGPVRISTSFPIEDSIDKAAESKVPLSKIEVRNNNPVSVFFDGRTESYTFQLPYLYLHSKGPSGNLYSLMPPRAASRPETDVAEEFRCKALSDAELTYRFLLCRTSVVDTDARSPREKPSTPTLGSMAYYILSDGREASASVKLTFEDGSTATSAPTTGRVTATPPDSGWQSAAASLRLADVNANEFRLRFNTRAWADRIEKPQMLADQKISDFAAASKPSNSLEHCVWQPGRQPSRIATDSFIYSLSFQKDRQSLTSAIFEIESIDGLQVGSLQCYFPKNPTPADITVGQWLAIVGGHIGLEVRQ